MGSSMILCPGLSLPVKIFKFKIIDYVFCQVSLRLFGLAISTSPPFCSVYPCKPYIRAALSYSIIRPAFSASRSAMRPRRTESVSTSPRAIFAIFAESQWISGEPCPPLPIMILEMGVIPITSRYTSTILWEAQGVVQPVSTQTCGNMWAIIAGVLHPGVAAMQQDDPRSEEPRLPEDWNQEKRVRIRDGAIPKAARDAGMEVDGELQLLCLNHRGQGNGHVDFLIGRAIPRLGRGE